ncbi:xanthine dehydrogenase family Fe-S subunit [Siccirubricoccus phaeus]|uniref:xanthine dehydrogenase family Fe-S subunit n=1 Tax=Siccirubricoccus phaeus TaxID=2595053 RepID=UPI0011F22F3F|nr:2Fe-2S iron-sulfur cluster-binding protein [Siccirubricoccus phaeus]
MRPRPVALTVNGDPATLLVEPRTHLADALREQLNLTGTHLGCEQGVCGACTLLIDGKPQRACLAFAVDCEGSAVTTIEGFDADPTMAALREAFSAHHALQCGFCTPGMLVTARDVVLRLGEIPEARLREELAGNLCRCTGYVGIVAAVQAVAAGRAPQPAAVPLVPEARRMAQPEAAAPAAAPAPRPAPSGGGNSLTERVAIAAPPDAVWAVLSDLPRLAACLPGAVLDRVEGDRVTGSVAVALGPIRARFAGSGEVALDAAARAGRLRGQGGDAGTGSRAEGEIAWQLLPAPGGSEVEVTLGWRLTGGLAQFNRAGLVRDVVRRVAQDFARNLEALIAGETPPPARPIGVLALLWGILRSRLFRR